MYVLPKAVKSCSNHEVQHSYGHQRNHEFDGLMPRWQAVKTNPLSHSSPPLSPTILWAASLGASHGMPHRHVAHYSKGTPTIEGAAGAEPPACVSFAASNHRQRVVNILKQAL